MITGLQEETFEAAFRNLTPEDLRVSNIPNESVQAIWVEFDSKTGGHYTAVHVPKHPKGTYILLAGSDKDRTDFKGVRGAIADEAQGKPERNITYRRDDICEVISLRERLTQKRVAGLVERYQRHFNNVVVPIAYYHNIPRQP